MNNRVGTIDIGIGSVPKAGSLINVVSICANRHECSRIIHFLTGIVKTKYKEVEISGKTLDGVDTYPF